MSEVITEAKKHLAAGRQVVPCEPGTKKPIGTDWANRWPPEPLIAHLEQNLDCNIGLVLGPVIDIEWDSADEEAAFNELFDGQQLPPTPCFRSNRGKHQFFAAHSRLTELNAGVVHYRKLGIRLGGKAAQTVIPPSQIGGVVRQWEVSFDDCEPAELPEIVVDRIIEARKPAATAAEPRANVAGTVADAVRAMLKLNIADGNDGSKRLYCWACRVVGHNLDDQDGLAAIRKAEESKPFPRDYSDPDVLKRVRDAEAKGVKRGGELLPNLRAAEGRTDAANAARLGARFGGVLRWCDPWKEWLVWDSRRWAVDRACVADARAKDVAKTLWTEVADAAC